MSERRSRAPGPRRRLAWWTWLRPEERGGRYVVYDRKRRQAIASYDTRTQIAAYIDGGGISGRDPERILEPWQLLHRRGGELRALAQGTIALLALMESQLASTRKGS